VRCGAIDFLSKIISHFIKQQLTEVEVVKSAKVVQAKQKISNNNNNNNKLGGLQFRNSEIQKFSV